MPKSQGEWDKDQSPLIVLATLDQEDLITGLHMWFKNYYNIIIYSIYRALIPNGPKALLIEK